MSLAADSNYNSSRIFSLVGLVQTRHVTEYPPAKFGECLSEIPHFSKVRALKSYSKDNKQNSLYWAQKYTRIFILGHYLFLSENCSLLGKYNLRKQISVHIFAPNGGYCLYSNNVFRSDKTLSLKIYSPRDVLLTG